MTCARGGSKLATAILLAVAGVGCADNGDDPTPTEAPTTATSTPTSSPTESPTPTSESETAAQEASDLVREFYSVRNRLRQNPDQPLKLLERVATSTELSAQQNLFKRERRDGLHQTGDTKVADLKVQSVSLDNSDPESGKVPTVQVDVCFDVSDVDILNGDGESIVSADRPDTGWIRYSVANYEWDSDRDGGWRVASSQDIEQAPCAAL